MNTYKPDDDVRLLLTVLSGEHGGDHTDDGCDVCAAMNRLEAALSAQPAQHPDCAAVDRFAAAMKEKLAEARAKGRGGWQAPQGVER